MFIIQRIALLMKKWNQDEFNKYFETALEKLSKALEFDPMELLEN